MKEKAPIDEFKEELIPLIEKFERKTHMTIIRIRVSYGGAESNKPIVEIEG